MNLEQFIAEHGLPRDVAKQEHVFVQGERDEHLYLVKSGLLKAYYLSLDGKESIKSFFRPGALIGSLSSAYKRLPCSFSLVALKPANLVKVPFAPLFRLSQENQEIAKVMIFNLLELSMKKELREYEFLCLDAEQRYLALREREPELVQEITQNDLARYLGITPVALSRIKGRLPKISPVS